LILLAVCRTEVPSEPGGDITEAVAVTGPDAGAGVEPPGAGAGAGAGAGLEPPDTGAGVGVAGVEEMVFQGSGPEAPPL
jgi:hypothetical protein